MRPRSDEVPPSITDLASQLATDLRGFADRLIEPSLGSPDWIPPVIGDLCQLGEDFSLLQSEIRNHLVVNDTVGSGLFRRFNDRRGLDLWMLTFALGIVGEALQDLALALEQLMPRRYWRTLARGLDPNNPTGGHG